MTKRIQVIDSHTGGEPTRIIVAGGPELGSGSMEERRAIFRNKADEIRSAVVNEPRGSDVLVGGVLCEPVDDANVAGVVFFNADGFLGMCGHGTIGLLVTLRHLGRIDSGEHCLETPVGLVRTSIDENNNVTVRNVRSFRHLADVSVDVPNYGTVVGDVAWGGNWFFLVKETSESLVAENTNHLLALTDRIRTSLESSGVRGSNGEIVDHLELFCEPKDKNNHSRNFVLCPGYAYDRSPCGTGTSAKLACLAADGKLAPGEIWRQESVIGSLFECSYELSEDGDGVIPIICGTAHVTAESTLILDNSDPFCMGIRT